MKLKNGKTQTMSYERLDLFLTDIKTEMNVETARMNYIAEAFNKRWTDLNNDFNNGVIEEDDYWRVLRSLRTLITEVPMVMNLKICKDDVLSLLSKKGLV